MAFGGKYQLGPRIGGGGMAEVYEAVLLGAAGFTRPVAIKRMMPVLSSDPSFGAMFINEGRIAALLHHPNIASVLDFDRDDEGRYFMVLELIRGVDLRRLAATGAIPLPIALHLVAEVLRGLDYAHELEHEGRRLGIIHRDVSPHNVMISWDGAVKLVDFGIAKALATTNASQAGTIKGKVAYMSPEQAAARELDGRSDVFAVGVILHELCTGRRLFEGASEPEILARLLTQPIAPPRDLVPGLPADVDATVMRMLAREREARFASARAALEAVLGCAALSARAGLELAELMRARLPREAPRRRGDSERVSPAVVTPVLAAPGGTQLGLGLGAEPPVSASAVTLPAATSPARPAARVPATPLASAPLGTPRTLTADGTDTVRERPARRRGPGRLAWVALALVCAAAGVVVAWQISARRTAATVADRAPIDAGPARAAAGAPRDAGPSTPPPIDAGSRAASVAPLIDAGTVAPVAPGDRHHRHGGHEREPVGPPATLHIRIEPSWADVTVDDHPYGQSPQDVKLAPGKHRLVLRNAELDKHETLSLELAPGESRTVTRHWQR